MNKPTPEGWLANGFLGCVSKYLDKVWALLFVLFHKLNINECE